MRIKWTIPSKNSWSFYKLILMAFVASALGGCGTITWAGFDIADQVFHLDMVEEGGKRADENVVKKSESQISVAIAAGPFDAPVPDPESIEDLSAESEEPEMQPPLDPSVVENGPLEVPTIEGENVPRLELEGFETPPAPFVEPFVEPGEGGEYVAEKPVGPPLGKKAVRLECTVNTQQVLESNSVQSTFLNWPPLFGLAIPFSVFGSLATLAGVYWTLDAVNAGDTPLYLLMSVTLAWTVYLVSDLIGLSMVVSRGSRSKRSEEILTTNWARESNGCKDAMLVGDGFRVPLSPDGSLDLWDEAYIVRAWARGKGPSTVRIRGVDKALKIPMGKRCQWAQERGYQNPFCARSDDL